MPTKKLKLDTIPSTKESRCQTQNMKQNIRNQITTKKKTKKTSQLFNSLHSLTTTRIKRGLDLGMRT
jgi:hypothetical protein